MTKVKVAVIAILAALTLGALVVPTIAQQGQPPHGGETPPPGLPSESPPPKGPPGPDHPPDHSKGYPPDAPPKGPRDLPKGQDR
jgi:hypothetical protein